MKRLFDVKCPDGHVTEFYLDDGQTTAPCGICGATAKKIISAVPFVLDGASGHFPTATDRWIRDRERGAKQQTEEE